MKGEGSADQIISLTSGVIQLLFTWSCQAFLLLGLAWVGLKLDRSRSATTRYRIWLIALVAVAALPLLGALSRKLRLPGPPAPFPAGNINVIAIPVGVPQAARPAFSWPSIIWPALFASWAAGVMISLLRLGNSFWKLHFIQSRARAVTLKDLDCSYSDLLHSDDGGASIALSDGVQSPGLAGLFRPVILLPADILSWTSREERTSMTLWRARFSVWLFGLFAPFAAALAAAGLYGVMSYAVSQRRQELGLRMALGAEAGDVMRLVVGAGIKLTFVGLALGLIAAFALSRFIVSQLFGVAATDPLTYAGAATLLAMVALIACYLPAQRAAKVDPLQALRHE